MKLQDRISRKLRKMKKMLTRNLPESNPFP